MRLAAVSNRLSDLLPLVPELNATLPTVAPETITRVPSA